MKTIAVGYQLTVTEGEEIDRKIRDLCLEQSVELPGEVLSPEISERIVGRLHRKEQTADTRYKVVIEWPVANIGEDAAQFLNLLYGNISLKQGIKILNVDWSALADGLFAGPAFGIDALRNRFNIFDRPLSATALKPLGSTSEELSELAFQFAVGGIDIIKDDHGIANQDYAPFEKRCRACVAAVRKAAQKTGHRSYYFPNITADAGEVEDRYRQAADLGADGVLLCPHLAGLPVMRRLSRMEVQLPIAAHPAFAGSLTGDETQGFAPHFLYGQLWRALGADFVIYPNAGGRFSYTLSQCRAINEAARTAASPFKAAFPMPGGGIKTENIGRWMNEYGKECCFLIGGSLYQHNKGITDAAKAFSNRVKGIDYDE